MHAGHDETDATGALVAPIHPAAAFGRAQVDEPGAFTYTRRGNPTRTALEGVLARLHGARRAVTFGSGMAAVAAVAQLLKTGDHVLLPDDVYGNTHRLYTLVLPAMGIRADFVDASDPAAVEGALRPETRLLWLETPTNPTLKIVDVAACAAVVHRRGALVAVDNSIASPYFQRPLALGADVVVESTTKYLNGHDDVLGGAVLVDDPALAERLAFLQYVGGAVPGPFDCWLLLRGLKTLALRMERHQENAMRVARFLAGHPGVRRVYYPGLEDHPGHAVARRQMQGFSGIVSFEVQGGGEAARRVAQGTRYFAIAAGFGGVASLIAHPLTMTHASLAGSPRAPSERLLRLSVGIEAADDLIADLTRALAMA
ncbi:MAG TPA: aminotransferase class I/II-fold pyridoxal phosphate-dependent enzyme [Chloroflexota bacterium]|nr:aminotransferase class I/II-fold pyridoxal phosphate-dependent enzyme [Chloroflexota bacterium]